MSHAPTTPAAPGAAPSPAKGMMAGLLGAADKLEKLFEYLDGKMSGAHKKGSQSFRFAKKVFFKLLPLWTFLPFWLVALTVWAFGFQALDAYTRTFGPHVILQFLSLSPLFAYIGVLYIVQAIAFKALYGITEIPDAILHKNMLDTNRDLRDWIQPWFFGTLVFLLMMFICNMLTFLATSAMVWVINIAFSLCVARFMTATDVHKEEQKREAAQQPPAKEE